MSSVRWGCGMPRVCQQRVWIRLATFSQVPFFPSFMQRTELINIVEYLFKTTSLINQSFWQGPACLCQMKEFDLEGEGGGGGRVVVVAEVLYQANKSKVPLDAVVAFSDHHNITAYPRQKDNKLRSFLFCFLFFYLCMRGCHEAK